MDSQVFPEVPWDIINKLVHCEGQLKRHCTWNVPLKVPPDEKILATYWLMPRCEACAQYLNNYRLWRRTNCFHETGLAEPNGYGWVKDRCGNFPLLDVYREDKQTRRRDNLCDVHPGQYGDDRWDCCGAASPFTEGCRLAEPEGRHRLTLVPDTEILRRYTPVTAPALTDGDGSVDGRDPRQIVVFDCEMAPSTTGERQLVSITALDGITGETLISTPVKPDVPMRHYLTQFTGLTRSQVETAAAEGRALLGREAARKEFFRFVTPDTLVVGHAVKNDLDVLGVAHARLIDTQVLAKACPGLMTSLGWTQEEGRGTSYMALRQQAKWLLGRRIQEGAHDAAEDARATCDVFWWYIRAARENPDMMEKLSDMSDEFSIVIS